MIELPPPSVLMPIGLQLFTDRETHTFEETERFLGSRCGLEENESNSEVALPVWHRRVRSAWNGLQRFGLAEPIGSEAARISEFGTEVAADRPTQITKAYLRGFSSFRDAELREAAPRSIQQELASSPLEHILGLPPAQIESSRKELGPVPAPQSVESSKDKRIVEVWFGTNRKPERLIAPGVTFSDERDNTLHCGRVLVNIPEGHRLGKVPKSFWSRWRKGTKGLIVKEVELVPDSAFWARVADQLAIRIDDTSMLLFIHGYNQSFEDAAIRAAQLKYDLRIPHAAFFSWPSKKRFWSYLGDESTVEASVPYLTRFVLKFITLTHANSVKFHIVAHSMGNRCLLHALARVKDEISKIHSTVVFDQVVFAAADVDADTFVDYASRTHPLSNRQTLYASENDGAISKSKLIHEMRRAGGMPPVTIAKGCDTVDASHYGLDIWKHGYVAEAREVLNDMFIAMRFGTPPEFRPGMESRDAGTGRYWRLT
jgi:esterase/lipase superfamily enzyme